jgi:hypothetical protein
LEGSGNPKKVPALPIVMVNNTNAFTWGDSIGFLLKAKQVFLFEPIDNGVKTRLVHYERMSGLLSPIFMPQKNYIFNGKGV